MQILIPQGSTVNLYKTHTADDRELAFSSVEAQRQYYNRHMLKQFNNVSVVKKNSILKLQISMGDAANCNMLSFINPDFDNKMFYAKILDYEYGNNNMTLISYEIDYWQTFMFDIEYYDSMIEREHLSEVLYQQALANPQDDSIIELRTPEDIKIPEEAYTYTNDGNSDWGAPSKIIPETNNDPVFLIQMAPFELIDESVPVDAEGKTLQQRLREFDEATGNEVSGFNAVLKDWAISDTEQGKDTGDITGFGIFTALLGESVQDGQGEGLVDYIKRRKQIVENFKPVKQSDKTTWEMFRKMFPEFKEPHLTQGAVVTSYNAILEYSEAGRYRLQQAIDFLTLQGVSASILGIYVVPRFIMSERINNGQIITVKNPSKSRHPKLNTGEFSFMSVQAPDGAKREYRYENFLDNNQHKFVVQASVIGNPVITLAPVNYLQTVSDGSDGISIENRIDFDNFPHLPYSTDGYLTYLSSQMQSAQMLKSQHATMQNTMNNASTMFNSISGGIQSGSAAGLLGGPYGAFVGGMQGAVTGGVSGIANVTLNNMMRSAQISDSDNLYSLSPNDISGAKTGDNPSTLWSGSEKAFVLDNYHAGSTHGWLPYLYSGIRFRLDFKYINNAYLPRYEKYFDHYGYKSTRFGVPRVGLWVRGDSSQEPHWETVNGLPSTYIKTDGCRVLGPFLNATRSIQSMFDSGVRFIKGDGL